MDEAIGRILEVARLAPSGDNTQPVRFEVDPESGTIALRVEPSSDPSPMNAGQRMSRMALGATLETLIQVAEAHGLAATLEPAPAGALALVRLSSPPFKPRPSPAAIAARLTNRRAYDGRPVPADSLARLADAASTVGGVTTHWIVDRGRIEALAALIARADALVFAEPSMLRAFLAKVRFDRPSLEAVDQGLSLGSIEATAPERMVLRIARSMPDAILRISGASKVFANKSRQLVRSASGLCLVVAPDGREETDVLAGRAFQRAWLALASEGLAAQPTMTPLIVENVVDHGDRRLRAAFPSDKLQAIREEFRSLAPEIAGRRPAWLMRFGYAPDPTGRTGRLPVEAIVRGPGVDAGVEPAGSPR